MIAKAFFESKNYNSIMFLLLTIVSILVLFNFVNFIEEINSGVTAYAIAEQNITQQTPKTNLTSENSGEMYTFQAWSIFYIGLITIIASIIFLSLNLKNTIQKNIEEEERESIILR